MQPSAAQSGYNPKKLHYRLFCESRVRSRCRQLGVQGVTLHSYRYAWAERAKTAGYPERFAQEALGHNSKAVHRAYAKRR
jgi:integrase